MKEISNQSQISNSEKHNSVGITYVVLTILLVCVLSLLLFFFLSATTAKKQNSIGNNPYTTSYTQPTFSASSAVSPRVIYRSAESNIHPTIPATCALQPENGPFVTDIYSEGTTIHGEFHGVIQTVITDDQKIPKSLTLLSPDKNQTKSFDITQARNEIFNLQKLRDIPISNLTPGKEIYIFFTCAQENNYITTFTKIGIVQ